MKRRPKRKRCAIGGDIRDGWCQLCVNEPPDNPHTYVLRWRPMRSRDVLPVLERWADDGLFSVYCLNRIRLASEAITFEALAKLVVERESADAANWLAARRGAGVARGKE